MPLSFLPLSRVLIVLQEPLNGLIQRFVKRCEFEITHQPNNFLFEAGLRNCPSACVVSKTYSP